MNRLVRKLLVLLGVAAMIADTESEASKLGPPPQEQPGDRQINGYMAAHAVRIEGRFMADIKNAEDWTGLRSSFKEQYFYMLGLWPLPERTPLNAKITGTCQGNGYVVDNLHYQSRPGLYVTANLYRPVVVKPGERLPAILYVCGHSQEGRDGNKTAYQSHGIWFARHGYICLVLDTLQLGEIASVHHGTYREHRWWWHSRGYTPAGVECWNGIRGLDYLAGRPDVDADRIAVTGISGGGAATFWIAAADERAKVAVPVSGMSDLVSYVPNAIVNGHCDCMFMYNVFEWPWTQIAAMIAPRPLLFVNSDQDRIFPMDANERIINRLKRMYSLFGASDKVECVVSVGGHEYRKDIRQAVFRFINIHLKGDPSIVADSEEDLVKRDDKSSYPIPKARLRVFPEDKDIPADALNAEIDRYFVPVAKVKPPPAGGFDSWKQGLMDELRRVTFRHFPAPIPKAEAVEAPVSGWIRLRSEPGIEIRLNKVADRQPASPRRVVLVVANANDPAVAPLWLEPLLTSQDAVWICETRGVGQGRWTEEDPPNYVRRCHALLGWTAETGRVWDVSAAVAWLRDQAPSSVPVEVAGKGPAGIIAAYSALFQPHIAGVILDDVPATHEQPEAPQFLNVLRICDIPDVLGMIAPRPLTVLEGTPALCDRVKAAYTAAGKTEQLTIKAK